MVKIGYVFPSFVFLLLVLASGFHSCNIEEDGPVDTYPYPEGHITFQHHPIDLDQVHGYEPMGVLDIHPKEHGGFFHKQLNFADPTLPIYTLADGQITFLGRGLDDQYQITIKYSTTISTRLGHVGRIADWVFDTIGGIQQGELRNVFVPVKAGDTIAYVSTQALDLGVHDQSLKLNYIYPELYGFENRYGANPLNYYNEPLRSEFSEKIFRAGEPKGGKIDYDMKGRLIGNWFLDIQQENFFANQFAIAYDHVFSSRICLADGYSRYVENRLPVQYWIKGNGPKPEDIGVGTRIKYEGIAAPPRWIVDDGEWKLRDISNIDTESMVRATWLLELTGEEELKVEMFVDKTEDQVTDFTSNARKYLRKPSWKPFE